MLLNNEIYETLLHSPLYLVDHQSVFKIKTTKTQLLALVGFFVFFFDVI